MKSLLTLLVAPVAFSARAVEDGALTGVKDFKFKPLPDDLPLLKAEDHPIPPGSLGVKPQGKLPADWKPPVYSKK